MMRFAASCCALALAANPNGRTALYLRATALWKLDSLATSLTEFQRVIELDPFHQDALKAAFLGLALFGMATLWLAVMADMGATLLVTFNGLRLLRPKTS